MQGIWLLEKQESSWAVDGTIRKVCYETYHIRNGKYLEREDEPDKFKILSAFEDTGPTRIDDNCDQLISDLTIVLEEAQQNNDTEMVLHILELIVLSKFCIWNDGKYILKFSPWGNTSYPETIPENIRFSIAGLADILSGKVSDEDILSD